ncbi:2-hydroxyacyl-CoA dehydratase family protein, partial [Saccharomonospora iraqiensis]|uniref:2-hydroxyacyl-CoA dehydratase family protein n=1 Tax=Saccharomonospora iraqiensis TaxID=52698 RepID=UPI000593CCBB
LPVRLSGSPGTPTPHADRYLGTGVDPAVRSVLERLLGGEHGPLDLLVVSGDCEASRRLFYALRELHRLRRGPTLPPVRLVDVLHKPHRTTTGYVRTQIRGLRTWLAAHAGRPVGDDDLADAIARHDRLRTALSRMRALRRR